MGQKPVCAVFLAAVLLLCLLPSAGMLLPVSRDAGGNETLSALPAPRDGEGRLNTAYFSQLTDYLEDRYFLRQPMITAWSALNARLLRTSITEDVLLGRDGWLYFGGTLADYTGTDPLSERELFSAAHNLALMAEYCQGQGAAFLFTIAPNKNSLYPQHMPRLSTVSGPRNAQRLAGELAREGVPYLDLFALFRQQEETLYFPRDSHWNSKGAALAADAVNAALGRSSAYFRGPFTPERNHPGDLFGMLYPAGAALETDLVYGGGLEFSYDVPIRSVENLTILTSGGGHGSLLMFRDSFGNLLYPYLADSFSSALFSRAAAYRLDLAAEREADCVVIELVERNLRYLLQYVPRMPAPLRTAPAAEALEDSVPLTAVSGEGLTLVTGTLPREADPASPVYLTGPAGCREAFLLEDGGFGLYLPEDASLEGAAVLFTSGGQTLSAQARTAP